MPKVKVRRSVRSDAHVVESLIGEEQDVYCERYACEFNVARALEQSVLCVTVLDDEDFVVGFASFSISPPKGSGVDLTDTSQSLAPLLQRELPAGSPLPTPVNAIWLTGFTARFDVEKAAFSEAVRAAFATLHDAVYLLYATPPDLPPFEPLASSFPVSVKPQMVAATVDGNTSDGPFSVALCTRSAFVPTVKVRPGRVEDFDDLTALVAAAEDPAKRVTRVPPDFRLEDLLEASVSGTTPGSMVLVATDTVTQQPVGLVCVASSPETQGDLVRHYQLDTHGKLRRLIATDRQPPPGVARNSVHVVFMYSVESHATAALDLIADVFARYTHAEFVTLLAPHDVVDCPALTHFSFVPIRTGVTGRDALFVACRYASDVPRVRPLMRTDAAAVKALLAAVTNVPTPVQQMAVRAVQDAPSSTPAATAATCWVAEHRSTIVGLLVADALTSADLRVVARDFELDSEVPLNPTSFRTRYAATSVMEDRDVVREGSVQIKALKVNVLVVVPLFAPISRSFLQRVLAASASDALICQAGGTLSLPTMVASLFQPVAPRYARKLDADGSAVASVDHAAPPSVLFATSPRMLGDPRARCWARMVVVGASATGLSLLFSLVMCKYIHFVNLLLVSRRGLPPAQSHHPADWEPIVADTIPLVPRELALLYQPAVLRVVAEGLYDFSRTEDHVVTDSGRVEGWDRLIFAVGRQAAVPRTLLATPMVGVMAVRQDAVGDVTAHVQQTSAAGELTVVYGRSLDAVSTLTRLCNTRGVKPDTLVWVMPPQDESSTMQNIFGDADVYNKACALFSVVGVKVCQDETITGLLTLAPDSSSSDTQRDSDGGSDVGGESAVGSSASGDEGGTPDAQLLGVALSSGTQVGSQQQRVGAVLCTDDRDIDAAMLAALSKRSIVFDGRVIVTATYRTADPRIFAAGPVAMFTRRLGPSPPFDMVSQRSVGFHVASVLVRSLGLADDDPAATAAFTTAAAKAFGEASGVSPADAAAASAGGGAAEAKEGEGASGSAAAASRAQTAGSNGAGGSVPQQPPASQSRDVPMDPHAEDVRLALSGRISGVLTPLPAVETTGEPVLIPRYTGNVSARALLPLGYLYYRCQRRGWAGSVSDGGSFEVGAQRDVFYDTEDGGFYLSVTIDGTGTIYSVTYLGPSQKADLEAWGLLVGLPQTALSLVRFCDSDKANLLELLATQPSLAVLTRRFHDLVASLVTLTYSFSEVGEMRKRLRNLLLKRHEELQTQEETEEEGGQDLYVGDLELRNIESQLSPTSRRALRLRVLQFLHDNYLYLGDVALPDIAAELERAIARATV